ncbi:GFA family protein [Croceicoccus mobilis]|uniref:Aldehyde-activating protein n=1 Tax=Croceicoccus mobilis TaxID=1703339 RepID=A0A917DND0_9SPHN|nr:GFA family protein [Croceicoccus mobilis]GGD55536.1 aldehyde-activating protein [Croceicoccus mobilis]
MTKHMTGGCQCGAVRYSVDVADNEAYLCHCRMCQRATGGVSIAFKNVDTAGLEWQGEPQWYDSSPIAHRPFCAKCGTPLGFGFNDSKYLDLTIGSFDDPGYFIPTSNCGIESKHAAWEDTSHLPGVKVTELDSAIGAWAKAGLKVPE